MIAWVELVIVFVFWGAAVHAVFWPHELPGEGYLVACLFMLPLLASIFSIFVGEVMLRKNHHPGRILGLLLVSVIESAAFCLLTPWLWIATLLRSRR